MKKIIVCIVVCFIFYFIALSIFDEQAFNNLIFKEQNFISSKKSNSILFSTFKSLTKKDDNLISILNKKVESSKIAIDDLVNALPLIYIYNTHDKEEYTTLDYNLNLPDSNVKTASYILQEQLKLYDINSIVEERSPVEAVIKNNKEYKDTYYYSRNYFKETKEKYPSIKYFIDLHRDGVSKKASTAVIENKNYAKLMFFLGMGHSDSDKNYQLVKSLEEYINNKYSGLLRDTFIRKNDSYNQDLSPNSFLIEVGGNYNTIDEVYNSTLVLAETLAYYIGNNNE